MNNICFTNLGTVNCSKFELTNELFFKKMNSMISKDADSYNVSYDKENDTYVIIYDNNKYEVRYRNEILTKNSSRKDIIELLNKLIDISKTQGEIQVVGNELKNEEDVHREKALINAKQGIIHTNEEKESKIELLKDDYNKNKTKVFKDFLYTLRDLYFSDILILSDTLTILRAGFGVGGVLLLISTIIGTLVGEITAPLVLYIVSSILIIDGIFDWLNDYDYLESSGILGVVVALIASPFVLGYYSVKRLIEKIKSLYKINKVKKTITNVDKKRKVKISKEELIEKINTLTKNKINELDKDQYITYNRTLEMVNNLKKNISMIQDKKKNKEYSIEFYEIIRYYIEAIENVKEKGKVSSILYDQINVLNKKVEEELRNEKMDEESSSNDLMEVYKEQKSIGRR